MSQAEMANHNEEDIQNLKQELESLRAFVNKQQQEIDRLKISEKAVAEANVRVAELFEELENTYDELRESKELAKTYSELNELSKQIYKQNEDILSSLKYAYRIQSSLLADLGRMRQVVPDTFVWLQPRDIVSGDFYFFSERNGKVYLAAVDCTGHGVPAAFTSVLGFSYLNQIINFENYESPAEILQSLHDEIYKVFRSDAALNHEGMDVGLCVIDKINMYVEYAGAKRPLIYIQNNELFEVKGSVKSIGSDNEYFPHKFENTRIYFTPESAPACYLFSDGITDLFGEEVNKKFSIKRLRELLLDIHCLPFGEQKHKIIETCSKWAGKKKQIDDIIVLGFMPTI